MKVLGKGTRTRTNGLSQKLEDYVTYKRQIDLNSVVEILASLAPLDDIEKAIKEVRGKHG